MDVEQLLTGSRWEVLERLARRPHSTTELGNALKTSTANASQLLRQLELAGLVERTRTSKRGAHYHYRIAGDLYYVVHLAPNTAAKRTYKHNDLDRFFAGLLLHPNAQAVMSFLLCNAGLVKRFDAFGLLDRKEPELFVLTEQLDEVRTKYANVQVQTLDGPVKVVLWSHSLAEIQEGMVRREGYYAELLRDVKLLHDPDGTLTQIREELEEHA